MLGSWTQLLCTCVCVCACVCVRETYACEWLLDARTRSGEVEPGPGTQGTLGSRRHSPHVLTLNCGSLSLRAGLERSSCCQGHQPGPTWRPLSGAGSAPGCVPRPVLPQWPLLCTETGAQVGEPVSILAGDPALETGKMQPLLSGASVPPRLTCWRREFSYVLFFLSQLFASACFLFKPISSCFSCSSDRIRDSLVPPNPRRPDGGSGLVPLGDPASDGLGPCVSVLHVVRCFRFFHPLCMFLEQPFSRKASGSGGKAACGPRRRPASVSAAFTPSPRRDLHPKGHLDIYICRGFIINFALCGVLLNCACFF